VYRYVRVATDVIDSWFVTQRYSADR